MKVNQFKKIEEALFSDLMKVGSDTAAFAKSQTKASKTEIQRLYLKDFIEDLIVDLDAAIKGGRVDPKIASSATQQPAQQQAPTQQQQPANTQTQQTNQPTQAPATNQVQQPQSAVQPTAQTRKDAKERVAQRKQRRTGAPASKPVDREEELAGVADLGYNESYHSFLNALVEGYIAEQTNMSIASWVMLWFSAYMKGVNWAGDKPGVEAIAREIETSFKKDRGKAAIQKLASRSWDLLKTSGGVPAGANQPKDQDLAAQLKTMNTDATSTQAGTQQTSELDSLKQALSSLSAQELQSIRQLLNKKAGVA
jgi:hypothetical protein